MQESLQTDISEPATGNTSQVLVTRVADWLVKSALEETDLESLVMGTCERLHAAGIPLVRGYFAFSVLHPLYRAIGIIWERGVGTTTAGYAHVPGNASDTFKRSPHYYMQQRQLDLMRVRLDCNVKEHEFPVLNELYEAGMTDYLAFTVPFEGDRHGAVLGTIGKVGMLGSWSTDRASGFCEDEIAALLRIRDRLGIATKLAIKSQLMQNVTRTYLGEEPGRRVREGQITRGDLRATDAAIWYADLRGSTEMADRLEPQAYVDELNTFFDAAGGQIMESGGEILSFIGDGLLAIFPKRDDEDCLTLATHRAELAARSAVERLEALNRDRRKAGEPDLRFGLGLHIGTVLYGNVGVPDRLTFSAFGAAVNEVTRVEAMTKTLGHPVIATGAFVDCLGTEWTSLGSHALRGVADKMTLHAMLAEDGERPADDTGDERLPLDQPSPAVAAE